MKRWLVAILITIPFSILTFVIGSFVEARGVDLVGGTAIMSLAVLYLLYIEDFSSNPRKKSDTVKNTQ